MTTLIGRRRIIAEQIEELDQLGAYPAGGIVVAGRPYTAADLLRILPDLPHGYLDVVIRELCAAEDRHYLPLVAQWLDRGHEA